MIKLSTKGRYGTRLMLNLARNHASGQGAVILKNVSEEEGISIRYLEQIIIPLKIHRLVKSIRGAGGGYSLAREPGEINMCQILEPLEGTCCLVDCVNDPDFCDRISFCSTHEVWKGATQVLKDYFEKITLRDILDIAQKKEKGYKTKAKKR